MTFGLRQNRFELGVSLEGGLNPLLPYYKAVLVAGFNLAVFLPVLGSNLPYNCLIIIVRERRVFAVGVQMEI